MRPLITSGGTEPRCDPQGGSIIKPEENQIVILTRMLPPDFLLVQIGKRGQIFAGIRIPTLNKSRPTVDLDSTFLPIDTDLVGLSVLLL